MIEEVNFSPIHLQDYKKFVTDEFFIEIKNLAKALMGKKVVHVNSTSRTGGGGVAEVLRSLFPLMKGVGLDAKWLVIKPAKKFFDVTQKIHDTLQGSRENLTKEEKDIYIKESKKLAEAFDKQKADIWIFHDPQPLAIPFFANNFKAAISRIHIDLSNPNPKTWDFLFPFFTPYKKIIFSLKEFVHPRLPRKKIAVFPPAIDPLLSKNKPLPLRTAKTIISHLNIHPNRPFIAQISRFDRWKDPIGVIQAFYMAKNEIPDLQLVLMGLVLASDNPKAGAVFKEVKRYVKGDPANIHLFYSPKQIKHENDVLVNTFQVAADVVIQKSIKEGFGLTVAEAMWKGKPVIGGNARGIRLQISDGYNGFLVNNPKECAERIVQLIKDPSLAHQMGERAHQTVKEKFLMPRLLRDYLKLFQEIMA